MAVLWKRRHAGVLYEVRTAGKTRRLYADGVCHTQFHPEKIVTGSVWDLLLLPSFFLPPGKAKRILVLGLGGGALVHLYQHFIKPENIIAVELDEIHIYVAKRFFDLKQNSVEIIEGDASAWMRQYKGPAFDIIVDDLFSHWEGIPQRAVEADQAWFNLLIRNMNDSGLLVMNFADRLELKLSAYKTTPQIRRRLTSAYQFSNKLLDNRVIAFSQEKLERSAFKVNLAKYPKLDPSRNMPFMMRELR